MIAGQCRDVAAGRGQAVDDDDERLALPQPRQRIKKLLGAGRRAAGAVDVDDDRPRHRRSGEPVELPNPLLIAADQTLNRDARNVGTTGNKADAVAQCRCRPGNAENDQGDGDDAPEGEFPPHPAAVDYQVSIKGHGLVPRNADGRCSPSFNTSPKTRTKFRSLNSQPA